MTFSSEELIPETDVSRVETERQTGVIGKGLIVSCAPTDDPNVVEQQHRAVCLTKPHANCHRCPHSIFTLVFNAEKKTERLERVLCPRWEGTQDRLDGKQPDRYVPTELATCDSRPFEYCASCPSRQSLSELEIDKTKQGWYSRFVRFTQED